KGDRTSTAEIRQLLEKEPFLVAETDGRIAAAVEMRVNGAVGYFGMLAVDKPAQGSGLGRALLDAAEQFCRAAGCTIMTLSTGEDRRDVISWYQRLGYRIT